MATRFTLARVGAAVLGAAAALVLSALPATAANGPSTTATPNPQGDKYFGQVWLQGHRGSSTTALLALRPVGGGAEIYTYCVDINTDEGGPDVTMVQVPWTDYPDQSAPFAKNSDKINWMLHNSFPTLSLSDLNTAAGTNNLSNQEAVEGTQAAIWHESDGVNLDTGNPHNDANVDGLYNYLVNSATNLAQPPANPALTVDSPSSTTGKPGGKIGPFTVHTNLTQVSLTSTVPSGITVTAVGANGKSVDVHNVPDGTKIYFNTSSGIGSGSGTFTLTADMQIGQLFVGQDVATAATKPGGIKQNCKKPKHQSLIVAQSEAKSKSAGANWTAAVATTTTTPTTTTTAPTTTTGSTTTTTAAATPSTTTTTPVVGNTATKLPFTGVNVLAPVVLAVVLIGAGGAFLLLQRRRGRA